MTLGTVYVTVGTTKFDALIYAITSDEALEVLKSRGCHHLILQIGSGNPVNVEQIQCKYDIEVEQYEFKFDPTRADIVRANLVIGHAGAGTCMDILNNQKPGLVVINEHLMDNHQTELALQLADEGYVYFCQVKQLAEKLKTLNFDDLLKYPKTTNIEKFVMSLNELMAQN